MGHIVDDENYCIWFYRELLYRVLGPLLFNIFLCNFFYFLESTNIASYADNTTSYNSNLTQKLVVHKAEEQSSILFQWFKNNYMKVNSDNSQILMPGNKKGFANIYNKFIISEDVIELKASI